MADKITIKENSDLLKKIVAEKGYTGYKYQYFWILQEIINDKSIYEELSEENKSILHAETGLNEEKIKLMSELVYGKPDTNDVDAEEKPIQTKIDFVLALLPYRKGFTYKPLPDGKRLNLLDEYIALLNLSFDMLRVYNNPMQSQDGPLLFRYAIKTLYENLYPEQKYDGLLRLFNGNVIIDLSMYNIAARMEWYKNQRTIIPPLYRKLFFC